MYTHYGFTIGSSKYEGKGTFTLAAGVLCIALIIWGKTRQDAIGILFYSGAVVCFVIGFIFEELIEFNETYKRKVKHIVSVYVLY